MDEKKRRLLTNTPPGSATEPADAPEPADATGPADAPEPATASARAPLSRIGTGWRIAVTAVALVILTAGQFLNTNDFFPLGSLTQYATAKDLNGEVNSTCIAARFPGEDEPTRLAFNTATVGIERGDVESQLQRVIDNPELLQTLADSYIRLHPGQPEPEEMILCRDTTQLDNGRSVGEPVTRTLATWEVQ
ncbi:MULTISPECIES: hypothetical protein [unclassified Brevibacterium]|uniref:hypothetical protein n=1 Tax=unclassified Brevibacterium TaxID=2614124 RepID=UPI0010F8AC75|nr:MULTISPECIES: hypothetical protein [unclassified Brevibacterium]MCM1013873.1 hypothetical protein [Brevibacterium sp. XM4083]